MPRGRIMPEMILLPNGQVLIINGGATGYASGNSIGVTFGGSNAANPIGTPLLYTPSAPLGRRFSQEGLPTTDIPRLYHSTNILTLKYQSHRPQGNVLLAGNNPNGNFTIIPPGQPGFSAELRVQTLDPPFFNQARPTLTNVPSKIAFNQRFTIGIDIPAGVPHSSIKVALIDLGFSTHAFHSSGRLVFMDHTLSPNRRSLTITSPPNNRVYPPGPAYIFVTVGDTTSIGAHVMVGSGANPPVPDQGIRLPGL
ncbi:hypothetical protein B0H14DRAFT_3895282 [Mycena olivaceomarginata]|nr:hypothetical protein B0H14DRAFT_3895282 [Mycena olivaceomarginata]